MCVQPVLLVGLDGVGKSDCVVALAALLGKALERVCITGETDSAELVGQLSPATLKWADGPVTKAIRSQAWCLLDNLDAADAVVMVRGGSRAAAGRSVLSNLAGSRVCCMCGACVVHVWCMWC
jgi:midasin (ATPase involved in ribosome maturation)